MPFRSPRLLPLGLLVLLIGVAPAVWAGAERVDRLVQILRTERSYKVRLRAVVALGNLKDRRAMPALVRALSDESYLVRGLAAVALGRVGDARALPALRDRLGRERHPFVRQRTQQAIRVLQPRGTAEQRRTRFYVTVGKLFNRSSTGGRQAVQILEQALLEEFARVPGVTTQWDGRPPSETDLADRQMKGFALGGGILRLSRRRSGDQLEISCSLKVSLDTYPGNSMKAVYSGEASLAVAVRDPTPAFEAALYRDIFSGAAREARVHIVRSYLSKQ